MIKKIMNTIFLLTIFGLFVFFKPNSFATPTATFEIGTYKDLKEGTPKGTLISSRGEVIPSGFDAQKIKINDSALMYWSSARAKDGTLYIGSGQPGKIYALSKQRIRPVADLNCVLVSALTIGANGNLIAATMPDARVIEVNPRSGKWKELGRVDSKYIWALLYDRSKKGIYAAAGSPGKIYMFSAGAKKAETYFEADDSHLLALAMDKKGRLLSGGSDSAILYRLSGKNKYEALHDFDATELKKIVVEKNGSIVVAVNKFRRKSAGVPRYDRDGTHASGTKIQFKTKKSKKKATFRASELRMGAQTGKGAIFRVSDKGSAVQLHSIKNGYFTDLSIDSAKNLWASDGAKGRVFMIDRQGGVTKAFDVDERQSLIVDMNAKTKYFATGDGGAIYQIVKTKSKPRYLSDVLDAKNIATWGNLNFYATAKLVFESRTGNTAKVDKSWSAWKAAAVMGTQTVKIKSRPARYIQLRATWKQAKGALRSMKLFYRADNIPAKIKSLKVERKLKKGERIVELSWKIDNPDKDKIVYKIFIRDELGKRWQRIDDEELTKTKFEWKVSGYADGIYRIKVVASDEEANGKARAMNAEKMTLPIVVDNRPPKALNLNIKKGFVRGIAKDSYSEIKAIYYAVDAGEWHFVDSVDGIFDSLAEGFQFQLPKVRRKGLHHINIKVVDAADNEGITRLTHRF